MHLFAGNADSEGVFRFANYWGEVDEMHAAKQHLEQQEGQRVVALLGGWWAAVAAWLVQHYLSAGFIVVCVLL